MSAITFTLQASEQWNSGLVGASLLGAGEVHRVCFPDDWLKVDLNWFCATKKQFPSTNWGFSLNLLSETDPSIIHI